MKNFILYLCLALFSATGFSQNCEPIDIETFPNGLSQGDNIPSATGGNHVFTTKQLCDSCAVWNPVQADNGNHFEDGKVHLGGTLIHDTEIVQNGFDYKLDNNSINFLSGKDPFDINSLFGVSVPFTGISEDVSSGGIWKSMGIYDLGGTDGTQYHVGSLDVENQVGSWISVKPTAEQMMLAVSGQGSASSFYNAIEISPNGLDVVAYLPSVQRGYIVRGDGTQGDFNLIIKAKEYQTDALADADANLCSGCSYWNVSDRTLKRKP